MISINHAFKIACRRFTYGAKINMNKHEKGYDKTGNNMKKVSQMKTADAYDLYRDNIRIHQA